MQRHRFRRPAPVALCLLGVVACIIAVVHFWQELQNIEILSGPVLAVLLDGVPALAIAYSGVRLHRSSLSDRGCWTVVGWGIASAGLFLLVIGATYLVRAIEGRPMAEPVFPLLIAAEAGMLAGSIAGYYNVRARSAADRAQSTRDAFGFVNELLRHDLRNDLTVIRARAELLAGPGSPTDHEEDDVAVIDRKAAEALQRIESTRQIAETLVADPEFETVDLVGICETVAEQVDRTFVGTVTTELPEKALVRANSGVRSIVDNIVENAAEHNDAEDPRVHIEVSTASDAVTLTVRDNGPGIPPERKRAVADTQGRPEDLGGLSLVQTLVAEYGGELRITDAEPRGSIVAVELPAATGSTQ